MPGAGYGWGGILLDEKTGREILDRILSLAFCRANDAIKLLFIEPERAAELIGELDLEVISEIKRNANGTVELKFIDRVEVLRELLKPKEGGGGEDRAKEFFAALESAAGQLAQEASSPDKREPEAAEPGAEYEI